MSGVCPKCEAIETLRRVRDLATAPDLENDRQTMIDALEAIAHEKLKLCAEHRDLA